MQQQANTDAQANGSTPTAADVQARTLARLGPEAEDFTTGQFAAALTQRSGLQAASATTNQTGGR